MCLVTNLEVTEAKPAQAIIPRPFVCKHHGASLDMRIDYGFQCHVAPVFNHEKQGLAGAVELGLFEHPVDLSQPLDNINAVVVIRWDNKPGHTDVSAVVAVFLSWAGTVLVK